MSSRMQVQSKVTPPTEQYTTGGFAKKLYFQGIISLETE